MSIITRINKAEKRIVDLYNKLKNLPSGGGGVQTISGDFVDNTDPLNPILNDPRPYKVYTALLSQEGTDAPVATVLENTLGVIPTFVYLEVGNYKIALNGGFTEEKTWQVIQSDTPTAKIIYSDGSDNLRIDVVAGDNNLYFQPIEIRVYN